MASVSEERVSVLIWSCSFILSHSLKSRSLPVPPSSVPLPFSSGLQLSVAAKSNDSLPLSLNSIGLTFSGL